MELSEILQRFPGISCAWLDETGRVVTECHGLADRERRIPVDENTLFPAASISKFVTALCLMRLQEQHVISIDAPVNPYLRTWKLRTPDGGESAAAIRHLLCHTAGVLDGEDGFYGLRQSDPEIPLTDILEGRTAYNNRPVRSESAPGTAFEYADAGYCVLQLLVEDVTGQPFEAAAQALVFAPLGLSSAFFASRKNMDAFDRSHTLAAGYDGETLPLPGKYPCQPDLAASALWITPRELATIAKAFLAAYHGSSTFLTAASAQDIAAPAERFPWTGLGVFRRGEDVLLSQGWGENGQCMLKMNLRTGAIAVVMTTRNPETDQAASGVEWLTDRHMQAM